MKPTDWRQAVEILSAVAVIISLVIFKALSKGQLVKSQIVQQIELKQTQNMPLHKKVYKQT